MNQKLSLRELKGAPLSIIIAIMMDGNRTVSLAYLCTETGYSDKTVANGLDLLRGRQIVTETRRNCYQLTGENVQLPLYWGETMEPADPSPASDQPALFDLPGDGGKFSGKNLQSGKIPESGKIPSLEKRVSALEKRVSELENRKNSVIEAGNFPKTGEIPAESGEFPHDNNLLLLSEDKDIEVNADSDNDNASGKIPETGKIPTAEESQKTIRDINEYYQQMNCGLPVFPEYAVLDDQTIEDLAALHPDPDVISFAIPRTATLESLRRWASLDKTEAKKELLSLIGITGPMLQAILKDESISLEEIDYHFWDWQLHKDERPKWTLGTVGSRIIRHIDRMSVKISDPLKFNYIG